MVGRRGDDFSLLIGHRFSGSNMGFVVSYIYRGPNLEPSEYDILQLGFVYSIKHLSESLWLLEDIEVR